VWKIPVALELAGEAGAALQCELGNSESRRSAAFF
jgi:hypothetical protein